MKKLSTKKLSTKKDPPKVEFVTEIPARGLRGRLYDDLVAKLAHRPNVWAKVAAKVKAAFLGRGKNGRNYPNVQVATRNGEHFARFVATAVGSKLSEKISPKRRRR